MEKYLLMFYGCVPGTSLQQSQSNLNMRFTLEKNKFTLSAILRIWLSIRIAYSRSKTSQLTV